MPRKAKQKMYFTMDTEAAIIEYNKSDDFKLRNKIYEESIKYPFEKLAENILNTFKFSYFDVSKEDVQMEVVSTLIEKIHMFQEGKGKAFSYFSIVAKNHLILKNNGNYTLNLNLFCHHKEKVSYRWDEGQPIVSRLFNENLEKLLGTSYRKKNEPLKQLHYDIAHSVQAMYEEAFFNLLKPIPTDLAIFLAALVIYSHH